VRLSALGDVIHTLPCLDALRRRFPKARIAWVVEELSRDLLEGHPQLDEVFVIPKKRWRGHTLQYIFPEVIPFFKSIRSRRFEVAVDFQGLAKSGVMAWLSGAPKRIGFGGVACREINGWFTNRKVDPDARGAVHIIDRNLSLLSPLGIEAAEYARVLPERPEWREYVDGWMRGERLPVETRFVALNPGAGWATKRWPVERFAEVGAAIVKELGRDVLIMWGPGEEEMARRLARLMAGKSASARVAPPTTVGQSIELTRRLDLFIGGDTGPTHLAGALGVPVVAMFGASDGERNHPAARRQVVLQRLDACPGGTACWKKAPPPGCELRCLTDITSAEVLTAARRLLQ